MILRRLELENIRSYGRASVEFPQGKTLFEGDIGAGKSTILMAIEFGFFGFGTEAGGSLLRAGSPEGRVRMTFATDEGEYTVERGLKRKGKGVQQTNGVLKTPEGDLDLSPSELKEKVLEVLGFNEAPDPRAQSWIYRYAVYTPQEEMKSVLGLPPDLRLQILRRAFGIEDYKTASENAAGLVREIKNKASEFEVVSRGIQELKDKLADVKGKREADVLQVAEGRKKQAALEEELQALRREKEELRERELQLRRSADRVKLLREKEANMRRIEDEEREASRDLAERMEAARERVKEIGESKPQSRLSSAALEASADQVRRKVERLAALEARIASKMHDYQTILKKGRCPVCDRQVGRREFRGKKGEKARERSHVARELREKKEQEKRLREQAKEMKDYELREKEAEGLARELERSAAELKRRKERAERARKEAAVAKFRMEMFAKRLETMAPFTRKVAEVSRGIDATEERLNEHRDGLSRMMEGIELAGKSEVEIELAIAAKEDAAGRRDSLQERDLWISDFFLPALQQIEKNVMWSLNQEFDSLFRRWFASLIDDTGKEARVDEVFTPIVTQDGYDQDIYYLSGGEKTSVALAYRLALNSLVQRVSAKSSILILDEPTDGFSKEQLGSVREVLDEVECQQVIVVSHEKELESFADQIYHVAKEGGESTVVAGGQ